MLRPAQTTAASREGAYEDPLSRDARGCCNWDLPPGFRRGVLRCVADPDNGRVANISGENFADIGFGIGYAQAQDGICLLAETFMTVDGERSAFLGPEGVFTNEAEGGLQFTNLNSDIYWASVKAESHGPETAEASLPAGPLDGRARSGPRLCGGL